MTHLLDFSCKTISITTPSKLESEHTSALALQAHLEQRHTATLAKIRAQDESDRRDMENVFCSRILAIVDATKREIPKAVQTVLHNSMQTNERLTKEIAMHRRVQEDIEEEIEVKRREASEKRKEEAKSRDIRRRVLINPPDMTVLCDEL